MVQTLYSKRVIDRMFTPEQLAAFDEEYEAHKEKGGPNSFPVNDFDLMIFYEYQKGATVSELKSKHRKSYSQINNSLRKVALSKLK